MPKKAPVAVGINYYGTCHTDAGRGCKQSCRELRNLAGSGCYREHQKKSSYEDQEHETQGDDPGGTRLSYFSHDVLGVLVYRFHVRHYITAWNICKRKNQRLTIIIITIIIYRCVITQPEQTVCRL